MTNRDAATLLPAGELRTGLFLPQYAKDASDRVHGLGTGFIAIELGRVLAEQLGVTQRLVEYPSPPAAIAGLKSDGCDVVFLGIEPARAAEVAFTPPLFQFDYAFIVPPASALTDTAAVDRPGMRIAIVEGHASASALRRLVKHAELVGAALPDAAFAIFRSGKADAFALPRDHALDYCERFAGSRVLAEGYGVNRVGIAVAKNRGAWLAHAAAFAELAKTSGMVAGAIARGGLRGFVVAAD